MLLTPKICFTCHNILTSSPNEPWRTDIIVLDLNIIGAKFVPNVDGKGEADKPVGALALLFAIRKGLYPNIDKNAPIVICSNQTQENVEDRLIFCSHRDGINYQRNVFFINKPDVVTGSPETIEQLIQSNPHLDSTTDDQLEIHPDEEKHLFEPADIRQPKSESTPEYPEPIMKLFAAENEWDIYDPESTKAYLRAVGFAYNFAMQSPETQAHLDLVLSFWENFIQTRTKILNQRPTSPSAPYPEYRRPYLETAVFQEEANWHEDPPTTPLVAKSRCLRLFEFCRYSQDHAIIDNLIKTGKISHIKFIETLQYVRGIPERPPDLDEGQ